MCLQPAPTIVLTLQLCASAEQSVSNAWRHPVNLSAKDVRFEALVQEQAPAHCVVAPYRSSREIVHPPQFIRCKK